MVDLVKEVCKKLKGKRLWLLLIVLLISGSVITFFYFGFVRTRLNLATCKFQMVSISVHSSNDEAVIFKLLINVSNPDWQRAQLDPASFDVIPAGFTEPMAHGWTEEAYNIPPYGATNVTLLLQVYDSPMVSVVLEKLLNLREVEFTISGFMTVTWLISLKIPFTFNYTLETRRNLLDMVKIVDIEAMMPGTIFNATIRVDNPFDVPLDVSSLSFDVFNESRAYMLKGALPSPLRIPPLGQANASVLFDVRKSEFEWLIGTLVNNETVGLLINGNVSAKILTLHAFLNLNLSKTFHSSRGLEMKLDLTSLGPIKRNMNSVAFDVPVEVRSPIECNVSFIHFELYDRLSSYVGFGYASYEPPLPLSVRQKTLLTISMNMTLPAFRSLVVQVTLGEPVNLQIRNGVISIFVYQTVYNIHFERRNQTIRP